MWKKGYVVDFNLMCSRGIGKNINRHNSEKSLYFEYYIYIII